MTTFCYYLKKMGITQNYDFTKNMTSTVMIQIVSIMITFLHFQRFFTQIQEESASICHLLQDQQNVCTNCIRILPPIWQDSNSYKPIHWVGIQNFSEGDSSVRKADQATITVIYSNRSAFLFSYESDALHETCQ